jgi:hypothetical protein
MRDEGFALDKGQSNISPEIAKGDGTFSSVFHGDNPMCINGFR